MLTRLLILISLLNFAKAEAQVRAVYHTADLLARIEPKDTTYVVNFWATWCKPCVEELPALDSLNNLYHDKKVKVLLVNIDFLEKKSQVDAFLKKKNIKTECVLLDEINGNEYIDKISPQWSGAIPATLMKKGDQKILVEKKCRLAEFQKRLEELETGGATQRR